MYPINKTDLDVLRFAHFLALAALTVRFLPRDWPGLKSPWLRPLILCGQHSLEIFCLGVFLAFAGHFILAEVSGGAAMHALISLSGILIMWGVAWVISWYKRVADKRRCENKKRRRQRRSGGRGLMKAKVLLSLVLLCGNLAAPLARAGDAVPAAPAAPPACELPSYLLTTESQLPRVADAIKAGKPLEILVIGSRSTTIPASEAAPIRRACRPSCRTGCCRRRPCTSP